MMVCQFSVVYLQGYLKRFRYLPDGVVSEKKFKLALRLFQHYAGLQVTGKCCWMDWISGWAKNGAYNFGDTAQIYTIFCRNQSPFILNTKT